MKNLFMKLSIFATLLIGLTISVNAEKKPNIILIMADDMGYECIGANGSKDYKTPFIDKLAAGGMRFEQCFANPICTPSRVKIMTGQYNKRNYVKFGLLDRSQKTFAHQLKKVGYATVIAGKWQLGSEPDSARHFGFDQSCLWQHTKYRTRKGTKFDSRFPNPQIDINGVTVDYNNGEYGPDVCADFICDFIETNKDKPFFAYYPMLLTHCPFDATPDSDTWDPKSLGSEIYKGPGDEELKHKYFRDMVNYADKLVGKIVAKVDSLGLRENTIIIFTGDNGTDRPIKTNWQNKVIAGAKGAVSDFGTRVPFIVNWPGKVAPKIQGKELVEFSDILPTLCEISGAPLPENYPGDGVSLWPTLSGDGERVKDNIYIWYKGVTWVRNVNYGVRLKNASNEYTYQKFTDLFEREEVELNSISESEKVIFSKLKRVIEDMSKVDSMYIEKTAKKKDKKKNKKLSKEGV